MITNQKLVITRGLPGSGKTTWALSEANRDPKGTIRVNRDDIRNMLGKYWVPRVWEASHKGVIHLYGHSHDSIDKNGQFWGKSMDCGIDSARRILGEYRPFSIEEIISIMDKRDINFVDHHNKETNI